ncbi:MAG: SGNH/GDSL hydrolase family protein [Thermodesulfobacteriota bacterium]
MNHQGKKTIVKYAVNLLVVVLSLAAALTLAEIAFRWYFDVPALPWCYRINSLDFRGREPGLGKPADSKRIMLLGDSYTFGYGVPSEDIYASLLEKRSREYSRPPVEVLNFSRLGWNTKAETEFFFSRGVQYDFDVLILSHTFNDIELKPIVVNNQQLFCSLTQMTMLHSLLYVFYQGKAAFENATTDYSQTLTSLYKNKGSPEWKQMADCILRLNRYCSEKRKRFVLFYFEIYCDNKSNMRLDIKKEMIRFADENKIPFVGIEPVPDCDLKEYHLYKYNAHPNNLGHRLAAEALMNYFQETERQ